MTTKILTTLSDSQREILDQIVEMWQKQVDDQVARGERRRRRRVTQADVVREGLALIARTMGLDWPHNVRWGVPEPTNEMLFPFGDIAIRLTEERRAVVVKMAWSADGITETPVSNWEDLEEDALREVAHEPLPGLYRASDELAARAAGGAGALTRRRGGSGNRLCE